MQALQATFLALVKTLSQCDAIRAIGKTGGPALPDDAVSDIDLFLFCDCVPAHSVRERLLRPLEGAVTVAEFGETEHPHWGLVDSVLIGGQEVYLMYFTQSAFEASVEAILRGERTEREENYFYPTGRLASDSGYARVL